jgi:arylsulfatase A-like enzyme
MSSPAYRESLRTVDQAISSILGIYRDLGLLDRTTVFVTALNNAGEAKGSGNGSGTASAAAPPRTLWVAWGAGIKSGHLIKQPVSIMDTGATVMRTLGLATHTEWESKAVEEIFSTPRPASSVSTDQGGPGGLSDRTSR